MPDRLVTNEDLARENPDWNMPLIESKTGVHERRIAGESETAADIAYKAVTKLIAVHHLENDAIDGIVYCTQSPDYIMPPNSTLLHARLGMPKSVAAFDFNLACSGFIYAVALASGLIESNVCNRILLVTADTYSKYIHPRDRSTRSLFGDAAAASLIERSEKQSAILDIVLATDGTGGDKFIIKAGANRLPRSAETALEKKDVFQSIRTDQHVQMDGQAVMEFCQVEIPRFVHAILERNGISLSELKLILFHQASGLALKTLTEMLDIPPEKTFSNLKRVGNTVSASLPILIKDAESAGVLHRGDLVLLVGFGVGFSWGGCLMRW